MDYLEDNWDDEHGPEMEDHRLVMPGATIICHRTKSEPRDDDAWRGKKKPSYEEMRAALDLDPDCKVARVFEVTAERAPDGRLHREMRYHDGVVPRISVSMDEDNQVLVAVFSHESRTLRRHSLADLAKLGDLAQAAIGLGQQAIDENTRLKAEIERLRSLLSDQAPKAS